VNASVMIGTSPGASNLLPSQSLSLLHFSMPVSATALAENTNVTCFPAFACIQSSPAIGASRSSCSQSPLWIDSEPLSVATSAVVSVYGAWSATALTSVDSSSGAAVKVPTLAEIAAAKGDSRFGDSAVVSGSDNIAITWPRVCGVGSRVVYARTHGP
jgi:hypothetical protein